MLTITLHESDIDLLKDLASGITLSPGGDQATFNSTADAEDLITLCERIIKTYDDALVQSP